MKYDVCVCVCERERERERILGPTYIRRNNYFAGCSRSSDLMLDDSPSLSLQPESDYCFAMAGNGIPDPGAYGDRLVWSV
jgi:hypothetical protein